MLPSFVTPARLAALVGVLTGLSASVTSALNVIPHDTAIGRAVVGSVGVIGTVITVARFLEGQAGWEQQAAQHQHELAKQAVDYGHAVPQVIGKRVQVLPVVHINVPANGPTVVVPEEAALPDEVPIVGDSSGEVVQGVGADGEPLRLGA